MRSGYKRGRTIAANWQCQTRPFGLARGQGTRQQPITDRTETMMDWTSAVPPALLELTLKGWINVGFIALIVLIAAVAAILGRVPRRA